jgi:hypothetical protein
MTADPYRNSLSAMVQRREALVRELEALDAMIRDRADLVIPCGGGLTRWQRRRLKRAWAAIRKLGRWNALPLRRARRARGPGGGRAFRRVAPGGN